MWVWRTLGYDNVTELPSAAIAALGRRCRLAADVKSESDDLFDDDLFAGDAAPTEGGLVELDHNGQRVEIFSAASPGGGASPPAQQMTSTYRLAPLKKLRMCIPGALELENAGPPRVECDFMQAPGSLEDMLSKLVRGNGGIFIWRVPMVDAKLRPDIADECCYTPAPVKWPLCVTGVTFGAEFEFDVTAPWPPPDSPTNNRKSICWRPERTGPREEPPIECEGFRLRFLQRGGPPLDPRRLNTCSVQEVAEELQRWVDKILSARPDTWCTLNVSTKEGEVSGNLNQVLPAPGAAARRQTGDIVVAVAADAEVALEPFELSYGDAHISSLQRMLEDEIAHVLGVHPSQVMCGDFIPGGSRGSSDGGGARKRHIRNDSIGMRFALLHTELGDLMAPKEIPRRVLPALPSVKPVMPRKGAKNVAAPQATQSTFQRELSNTLKAAGVAMCQLSAMSQSFQGGGSKAMGSAGLCHSNSAPSLPGARKSIGSPLKGASPTSTRPSTASELPPDLLLKRLVSTLSETKHPLRRHPDVFPMLSRIMGKIRSSAVLVVDREVVTPGRIADDMRALLNGRANAKRPAEMDADLRLKLTTLRSELLRLYEEPGGAVAAQKRQLTGLSAKELLDELEGSVSRPLDLGAALLMLLERTDKDTEWCLRLRSHHAVERILALARRFNSERSVVSRCIEIIARLTANDGGCVDNLIEKDLAPDVIQSVENFPQEKDIQFSGVQVLRRLYIRAREVASHGPRVVCLGKRLPEVWTFKGLDRILAVMRLFGDDAEIQIECFTLLASLAEMLYNNGMAAETFKALDIVMRRHADRPDILAKGVLIIARLGPSFLQHEHRGVSSIVEALGRHRSSAELQRVGMRAIVALCREEKALYENRVGGSVSVVVAAMSAHSKDEQVIREGSRALEKLCPRALNTAIHICNDLAMTLPQVSWSDFAQGSQWEPALKDSEWDQKLLKNFREDIASMPRRTGAAASSSGGENDDEPDESTSSEHGAGGSSLATIFGFRASGLREEFDASDGVWATSRADQGGNGARERDIQMLSKYGCMAEGLRSPGPTSEQLKRLCEAFKGGLAQHYTAQDGELLASLIGHLAWCSARLAKEIVSYGGAQACKDWLRSPNFAGSGHSPEETALTFPLQRACLGALSSICMHDRAIAEQIMGLGGVRVALDFATHQNQRTQRAAIRLLARLMPSALSQTEGELLPQKVAWELTLRELRDGDEVSRTCAAACALEICEHGMAASADAQVESLADAILFALTRAVGTGSSPASLPLILAAGRLLDCKSDPDVPRALLKTRAPAGTLMSLASTLQLQQPHHEQHNQKQQRPSLVQLLAFWLPKGVAPDATIADKGAATAAAMALKSLSEIEAPLPFREMKELMVCGQSSSAEQTLQQTCTAALLLCVEAETQPQQLAHLFSTTVGKARDGEERLADINILEAIAKRIVHLLGSAQGQATDVLVNSLRKVERLIPEEPRDQSYRIKDLIKQIAAFVGHAPQHTLSRPSSGRQDSERSKAERVSMAPAVLCTPRRTRGGGIGSDTDASQGGAASGGNSQPRLINALALSTKVGKI